MALWKPFRGSRTALDAVEKHDGYVYFCVDDGSLFFDYTDADGNLQRKQINAKEAESLIGFDPADYQPKGDDTLVTTDKTVVGAINELDDRMDALIGDYSKGLEYTLNEDGVSYSVKNGTCEDENVVIPREHNGLPVTSIGDDAFRMRYEIKSVIIPDTVTDIGSYAFQLCSFKNIIISPSVKTIKDYAFSGCSLEHIAIPNSITSIGEYAFLNCRYLKGINIPNSITSISEGMLMGCESLVSITIPKSVTSIGDLAFAYCKSLTSIDIPNSVTSIGDLAFDYCPSLKTLTIPSSVTSFDLNKFTDCESLTIYCEAESQPSGWNARWNESNCPVIWGCSLDIPSINDVLNESITTVSTTGTGNAITSITQSGNTITATKGASFLTAHPVVSSFTNSTSTATPSHGGNFTVIDGINKDSNGHITSVNTKTVTLPMESIPSVSVEIISSETAMQVIKDAIDAIGSNITRFNFISFSGMLSETLLFKAQHYGGNTYNFQAINLMTFAQTSNTGDITSMSVYSFVGGMANMATTTNAGLMSPSDKTKLDNTNIAYGTCDTDAETAEKAVVLNGNTQWALKNGSVIMVKFTNSNTASNVKINVNNTGAYPIWYNTAEYTSTGTAYTGCANRTITYMFNGTHYVFISDSYDANTQSNTNSTDTDSKIYLVGATSQGSNKTTYSHNEVYVGTDHHVYSNGLRALNTDDLDNINAQLGDISSALDELHTYAEAIVNG